MQKMRRTGKRAALPAMAALAAATENETIGCVMAVTSFHDGRGILSGLQRRAQQRGFGALREAAIGAGQLLQSRREVLRDRKSTRLNSSHPSISYAVFCLKKKKKKPSQRAQQRGAPTIRHRPAVG